MAWAVSVSAQYPGTPSTPSTGQTGTPPAGQSAATQCSPEIKRIDAEVARVDKADPTRADEARKLRAEAVKFEREGNSKECLARVDQIKQMLNVK